MIEGINFGPGDWEILKPRGKFELATELVRVIKAEAAVGLPFQFLRFNLFSSSDLNVVRMMGIVIKERMIDQWWIIYIKLSMNKQTKMVGEVRSW